MPLRALAVNVIAIYSRSRRKRRKLDSMTPVEPLVERLYSLDELLELRRNLAAQCADISSGTRAQSAPVVGRFPSRAVQK
jgi:hypothetical protein